MHWLGGVTEPESATTDKRWKNHTENQSQNKESEAKQYKAKHGVS